MTHLLRKLQINPLKQQLTHCLKFQKFLRSKSLKSQALSIQKNKTSNLKSTPQQTKLNKMSKRYKSSAIYLHYMYILVFFKQIVVHTKILITTSCWPLIQASMYKNEWICQNISFLLVKTNIDMMKKRLMNFSAEFQTLMRLTYLLTIIKDSELHFES